MHVPDGFLSPAITLPAWGVAAPLWGWALRRHLGPDAAASLPLVGSLTAVAFVLQTLLIPVPGGTSAHLTGIALLAILRGPAVAFVCESLVLLLQALFFGAGGLTVLGVNALAMGLLGPATAWVAYRALRPVSGRLAAFAGAWLGVQVSTLAVTLLLGLQHRVAPAFMPIPLAVTAAAMLPPALLVLGPVEGLYTVAAMGLLRRTRLVDAG